MEGPSTWATLNVIAQFCIINVSKILVIYSFMVLMQAQYYSRFVVSHELFARCPMYGDIVDKRAIKQASFP